MHLGSVGVYSEVVVVYLFEPMPMLDARWDLNIVLVIGFADA